MDRSSCHAFKGRISSHPIHPMLVMFPFGLWVASFLFDLLGRASGNADLFSAGFYTLIGGCIGALFAAVPGVIDLFSVVPPDSSARQRGYIHGAMKRHWRYFFLLLSRGAVAAHRQFPTISPYFFRSSGWAASCLRMARRYTRLSQSRWHRPPVRERQKRAGTRGLAAQSATGQCRESNRAGPDDAGQGRS